MERVLDGHELPDAMEGERRRLTRSAARIFRTGVTSEYVRAMTVGRDTLCAPLTPTRECLYSDDPRAIVVREEFCGAGWHVRFVREFLIYSDYLNGLADAVMGAGETTAVLFNAARGTRTVRRLLDLGCGAGTLALLLGQHARETVATDINPRAVFFARFNAEINGRRIEVREGDLFEPVRGERFDLIVSQPPYYPGAGPVFLHGGPGGWEIAGRIIAEAPDYLTADGIAIVHTSLPLERETPAGTIEYTPGIGEIAGTRHSLVVIRREFTLTRQIRVPPHKWGSISVVAALRER